MIGEQRYHGTDVDGLTLSPDRLELRGVSVTDLIGSETLAGVALLLLTGERAQADAATALDAALATCLAGFGPEHRALRIAELAAGGGAGMAATVMAGLAGVTAADRAGLASLLPAGMAEGLTVTAVVPALVAAWLSGCPAGVTRLAPVAATFPAALLGRLGARPDPVALRLFEDVLVAWVGGLGYLPPSIMIPRLSIGTGVSITQALTSGFGAAGPNHIGATAQATALIRDALALPSGDAAARMEQVLSGPLAKGQRVGGFGHPLFLQDPRPPRLRQRAAELGVVHPALDLYDAACAWMLDRHQLRPNIDFITGTVCVICGLRDPGAAVGAAMTARTVGMLAHVLERATRPAFGVTSQTARDYLHTIPKGWL